MKRMLRWPCLGALGLGLSLSIGCQTWVPSAGMTLPSGHYLEHRPQYFAPSPPFPLSRELARQEEQAAAAGPVAPGVPGVVPVAPAVAPGPVGP